MELHSFKQSETLPSLLKSLVNEGKALGCHEVNYALHFTERLSCSLIHDMYVPGPSLFFNDGNLLEC